MKIPFNKPYLTGNETGYIEDSVKTGKISGNGVFTKKCHAFFESRYGFLKVLLTTSCTDALEMAAILCNVKPGDEVIVPSYTFVSSALAFVRQGATLVFADSSADHPNLDVSKLESLISCRTKVIVPVHYAGVACDMDAIMALAERHNIFVVEDAAQAIDSYYYSQCKKAWLPLGSIGHLGCFSFHETKNIIAGEGGLLTINDQRFVHRAEIIWEKGTNRSEFFRGEVNKYSWVDIGSSFLPSEIIAAFLYAQLEQLDAIQARRKQIWKRYYDFFSGQDTCNELRLEIKGCPTTCAYLPRPVVSVQLPLLLFENPGESDSFLTKHTMHCATNNAHMFYLVFPDLVSRTAYIQTLKERGILAVFHYLSLHQSEYNRSRVETIPNLPYSDHYSDTLLRLPLFYELQ